ncbi:hypothetical protein SLS58_007340 [Diplodia intermedia]|uniref:Xylanolytic transcriptional activator regulatory domain-containing protein n=1 Tax=Diplodia intermedia TaxID=856260 RepID=A0ABR3TKM0_9PEZI
MAFTYENEGFGTSNQPFQSRGISPKTKIVSGFTPATLSDNQKPLFEELEHIVHTSSIHGQPVLSVDSERAVYSQDTASWKPSYSNSKLLYREVFTGLGHGIARLFCLRLNTLGCSTGEQTALDNISEQIFQFQDLSAFEPSRLRILQPTLGDLEVQQWFDIWIAHHPLSFILSKALLLDRYRKGSCDGDLLAIILAEASLFLDSEDIRDVDAVFEAARTNLLPRMTTSISLSTAQVLVLLGWHDFCTDRPRQGYRYLELARKIVLRRLRSPSQGLPGEQFLDGIDVRSIETELAQNIYWFTFSISLWLSLQLSTPAIPTITPPSTVPLPVSDPSQSAVHRLDSSFGNVASLVAQTTSIRELWSLAHLAATVAPIFKHLLLHHHHASASASLPPHANIHSILAPLHHSNIPSQTQHTTNPSLTTTHLAHQLLAIHIAFLRPSTDDDDNNNNTQQQRPPSAHIVRATSILHSIEAFLASAQTLQRQQAAAQQNWLGDGGDGDGQTARWLALGLDTCGRALVVLGRDGDGDGRSEVLGAFARRLLEVGEMRAMRGWLGLGGVRKRLGEVGG